MVWILCTLGILMIIAGMVSAFAATEFGRTAFISGAITMVVGVVVLVTGTYINAQNFDRSCNEAGGHIVGDRCYGISYYK